MRKTIFDKDSRNELIERIGQLGENSKAQFGKMNIYQMLKHCTLFEEWVLGKNNPIYKQEFIGRLFGKMALNDLIKDESPLRQNLPTLPSFKVVEKFGEIEKEKNKWIDLIKEYEYFSNPNFIHSFFGKMTKEQIGYLNYKHADHHLRQFNA